MKVTPNHMTISVEDFRKLYGDNRIKEKAQKGLILNEDLEVLLTLWRLIQPRTAIEFGINSGNTAKALLKESLRLERYIGIDVPPDFITTLPQQQGEVIKDVGTAVKGDNRVDIRILSNGSRSLRKEDLPLADFIFIDGDHSLEGVLYDSLLAKQIIRPGGVICWHDFKSVHDVSKVLTFLSYKQGWNIKHVEGSILCYEMIQKTE